MVDVPQLRPEGASGPCLDTWPSDTLPLPEEVANGWRLCALDAAETGDRWGLVAGVFRRGSWEPCGPAPCTFRPESDDARAVLWGLDPHGQGWSVLWTNDCSRPTIVRAPHDARDISHGFADGRAVACVIGGDRVAVAFGSMACVVEERKRSTQIHLAKEMQAISSFRYHSASRRLAVADVQGYLSIVELDLLTPQHQQRGVLHACIRPASHLLDEVVRDFMFDDAHSVNTRHDVMVLELPRALGRLQERIDCTDEDFSIADTMWDSDGHAVHVLLVKLKRGARPPHAAFCTWSLRRETGTWEPLRTIPLGVTVGDATGYPFGAEGNIGAGFFEGTVAACFDAEHVMFLGRCNGGQVLNCSFCPSDGRLKDDVCPSIDADVSFMKMNRWPGPHCKVRVIIAAPGSSGVGMALGPSAMGLTSRACTRFEQPESTASTQRFFVASEGFLIVATAADFTDGGSAPSIQACVMPCSEWSPG